MREGPQKTAGETVNHCKNLRFAWVRELRKKLLGWAAARASTTRICGGAAYKVDERLKQVNAPVPHIANLLRFGEPVEDIARLGRGTRLQHKACRTGHHGSAKGGSPA